MVYDTIIIGAGAAGSTAGIYATRYALKTLIIGGPMPGGLITEALDVENYPGHQSISGMELANKFLDQAKALGANYAAGSVDKVVSQADSDGLFSVVSGDNVYRGRSIVLATGTHHRRLGVKGEEKYAGKGVSYCATCDGPFFKDKVVAVIGGGNSAVEGAQELAMNAKKVYIVYRSTLRAAPLYIEHLQKNDKVIEVPRTNVVEIVGDQLVKSLKLDVPFKDSANLEVDGVFIQIGYIPKNDLAKNLGVELTDSGFVKVNQGMGTNINGIFCAGDLNNGSNQLHQQVTSAAEGAIAAQSAYRFVQGLDYLVEA